MSALLEKIKLSKYPSSVWLGKVNGQEIIDLIEQQQAEIDTLKAHVERLREALAKCHDEHIDHYVSCDDVKSALDATPQQSLAEHDAELITKFIYKLVEIGNIDSLVNETTGDNYLYVGGILQFSNEYAKRIKDGE